jgi:ABC-type Mn2+/Zn2+ transport system permease subunit
MLIRMTIASAMPALAASTALAAACAVLSVIVILRRWAFVGEGISHSGFGGAGTAWLLALLVPALDQPWVPYVAVAIFCVATALAIGRLTRGGRVNFDAAVGVFLVASLAWGFLARQVYHERRGMWPSEADTLLFGNTGPLSPLFALAAVSLSAAVLIVIALLAKEITAYCFDPLTAQTSGVATGLVHDVLMVLLAVTIVLGTRVAGSVLVVALLILPGVTALLLSQRLSRVIAIAIGVALLAAATGVLLSLRWRFIPAGPAIVLCLFGQFVVAMVVNRAISLGAP